MTVEVAKNYLKNYPCVCKYGTSPYDCKDREGCEFGKAIRTIVEADKENDDGAGNQD